MSHSFLTPERDRLGQLDPSAARLDMQAIVEHSLQEILLVCAEACAARRSAPEGSAEWHKRTGEILACGKLTNVLYHLQESLRAQESRHLCH